METPMAGALTKGVTYIAAIGTVPAGGAPQPTPRSIGDRQTAVALNTPTLGRV